MCQALWQHKISIREYGVNVKKNGPLRCLGNWREGYQIPKTLEARDQPSDPMLHWLIRTTNPIGSTFESNFLLRT
jgi:hypothetical protein